MMMTLLHHVPTAISVARDLVIMAAAYRWWRYLGQIRVVSMASLMDGSITGSIRPKGQQR